MALPPGTRLGVYEVTAQIGAGGMGQVYRARDPRIGRDVAIKVLPAVYAADADRLRRFEQEARASGALNHPNVLTLYDVGTSDGHPYLVMELLDGETLRDRVSRGALLPARACEVAAAIAHGLAAAHAKGIVHRDLKPDNVMVTRDGHVKILDFGIAKLRDPETSPDGRTVTAPLHTTPDTVMGTAGYMAPEQVRGQHADERADLFALGAILFELLTGGRAFDRDSRVETLNATLHDDPGQPSAAAAGVPPLVDRIVKRCLEKDPDTRFQSARDLAFALEVGATPDQGPRPTRRGPARLPVFATAAAAVGLVAGLLLSRVGTTTTTAPTPKRLTVDFPAAAQLGEDSYVPFALSPDGTILAYEGIQPSKLFLRRLDTFDPTPLEDTDGASDPFFSPDGQWVGFWTLNGTIKKVPVAGGPAVTLCQAEDMLGASWGDDGTIVFAPTLGSALFVVPSTGGTPRPLTTLDPARHEVQHAFPQVVLGGRAVLFTATARSTDDPYSVEVLEIATGHRRTLVQGARYGRYLPTGHLVYLRGQTAFATRVDAETLQPIGPAVAVLENIASGPAGQALLSIAADGTLSFVPGAPPAKRRLVWADRNGAASDIGGLASGPYMNPRLSPDGRRVAVSIQELGRRDIWIYTVERETFDRMTFDGTTAMGWYSHLFTADGTRLTYVVDAPAGFRVVSQPVDGSGPAEELLAWPRRIAPDSWLPDGRTLLLNEFGTTTGGDILILRPGAEPRVTPFVQERGNQFGARLSPDGRLVAYAGDETGRFEIYVRPYPGPGPKRQLTTDGGGEPVWSRDGHELFYRNKDHLMVIPVVTASPFQAGRPRLLFEGRFVTGAAGGPAYDVGPDGRFLMMKSEGDEPPREFRVVLNWFEELKRLAPRTP